MKKKGITYNEYLEEMWQAKVRLAIYKAERVAFELGNTSEDF